MSSFLTTGGTWPADCGTWPQEGRSLSRTTVSPVLGPLPILWLPGNDPVARSLGEPRFVSIDTLDASRSRQRPGVATWVPLNDGVDQVEVGIGGGALQTE